MHKRTQSVALIREWAAFLMVLAGGLAVAMTHADRGCFQLASHASLSSMVHLSRTVTLGIDARDIARLQRIFPVTVTQLFEAAIPKHPFEVGSFFIDKYLGTNARFKRFVDRRPDWQSRELLAHLDRDHYPKHWVESVARDKENDPVVNANWYAATAYCQTEDERLPAEADWEYTERGSLKSRLVPWGDKPASPSFEPMRPATFTGHLRSRR